MIAGWVVVRKENTVLAQTPLLIVQAGTPPEEIRGTFGDLPAWFCRALERPVDTVQVIRAFEGEDLPAPDAGCIAIITGSWSMVTDREPWSEAAADWIRTAIAIDMPLFGVCYGHQLMSYALGGVVDNHPQGREIGSQRIELAPEASADPLFSGCPPTFTAQLTHVQSVITPPPGSRVLARSAHDPHQILRYGPNAVSTQFHPEFTPEIMAGIIQSRREVLGREERDPDALHATVQAAPTPLRLLRDFVGQYYPQPASGSSNA
jgi:GMP synthase (glutamine-hydrolysing)